MEHRDCFAFRYGQWLATRGRYRGVSECCYGSTTVKPRPVPFSGAATVKQAMK